MANIDTVKTEATEFYEKYSKELNNKDQFHKSMQDEKSKFEKKEPEVASRLPQNILDDISFGAQNIRTAIKEKYLGRLPGMKRGEAKIDYASRALTIVVSVLMMAILGYVQI